MVQYFFLNSWSKEFQDFPVLAIDGEVQVSLEKATPVDGLVYIATFFYQILYQAYIGVGKYREAEEWK